MPSKKMNKNNNYTLITTLTPPFELRPEMMADPNNKDYDVELKIELKIEGSVLIAEIEFTNKSKFSKKFHDCERLINSFYNKARINVVKEFEKNKTLTDVVIVTVST